MIFVSNIKSENIDIICNNFPRGDLYPHNQLYFLGCDLSKCDNKHFEGIKLP